MWLARLTEMGLLRASFVPPKAIRDLRDYTRARARLIRERTRCRQRLEKLLEGALVKLSSVASKLTTLSAQDMIKAMIAGQRDPQVLASLARRTMKAKHDALVEALDGMFDDHHGELAALLLDQIAALDAKITQLGARAAELTAAMPGAWGIDADGTTGPGAGTGPDAPVLNAVARLAEIPDSAPTWPGPSSPRPGWTWPGSPPQAIWCRGQGCARSPGSPAPGAGPGRNAEEIPGCGDPSGRPPWRPPAPPLSWVSGTTGSLAAAARPRPRSPWPAPSW